VIIICIRKYCVHLISVEWHQFSASNPTSPNHETDFNSTALHFDASKLITTSSVKWNKFVQASDVSDRDLDITPYKVVHSPFNSNTLANDSTKATRGNSK